MMHYLCLLHLFLSITRTLAAEFHQTRFILARNGSSTRLPCRQEGTLECMYWYRQVPGQGLILLYLSSYEGINADNEINDPRFSAERLNRQNFPLNIADLHLSDTAVYYCAGSSHDDTKPYCAQSKTCAALFLFPTRVADLIDGVSTEEIQASACSESNRQKPKCDNPAVWLKGCSDSQIQAVGSESCASRRMVLSMLPKNMGFLLFLLLQLDCVDLLQINQSPLNLVLHPGSPMKITCSVRGTSNPNTYWYRWTPTEGIRAIFYSVGPGSVEPPEVNAFSARRPNDTHFVLESAGVAEAEPPAVWYCAGSIHSDKSPGLGLPADCVDQPDLANCELIVYARLCSSQYYSSFCCAYCARHSLESDSSLG